MQVGTVIEYKVAGTRYQHQQSEVVLSLVEAHTDLYRQVCGLPIQNGRRRLTGQDEVRVRNSLTIDCSKIVK